VANRASNHYLLVQSCAQEDRADTDDASPRAIDAIRVPASTMGAVPPSRRRQQRAEVVAWDAQAHRTAALYGMQPGVLGTGGAPHGPQPAPRRYRPPAGAMSAGGRR